MPLATLSATYQLPIRLKWWKGMADIDGEEPYVNNYEVIYGEVMALWEWVGAACSGTK